MPARAIGEDVKPRDDGLSGPLARIGVSQRAFERDEDTFGAPISATVADATQRRGDDVRGLDRVVGTHFAWASLARVMDEAGIW